MTPKAPCFLWKMIPLWVLLLAALSACTPGTARDASAPPGEVIPTVNPSFSRPGLPTETSAAPGEVGVPPQPTASAAPAAAPASTPGGGRGAVERVTIYDESLAADWTLENSWSVDYDVSSAIAARSGNAAIAFTPTADYGSLFFSLKPEQQQPVRSDQTLGVSFWIYSEEDYIQTSDIAVSMMGSNRYFYWRADDTSVKSDYDWLFSETRLYYLDINQDIPPRTWVQVEVWLDRLPYDPEYDYVTGFFIKTEQGFRNTVLVDQVELVIYEDAVQ